jgi:hypothetical protein
MSCEHSYAGRPHSSTPGQLACQTTRCHAGPDSDRKAVSAIREKGGLHRSRLQHPKHETEKNNKSHYFVILFTIQKP